MNNLKKSNKEFLKEVYLLVKDEYIFLEEYKSTNTKILCKHNKCNHEWKITPNNFINNHRRCPKCNGSVKKSNKEFLKEIYSLVKDEYTFLEEYSGTNTKILCKHNKCNHEWKITPSHFINGKRCPKCANKLRNKKRQTSDRDFKKYVQEIVGDEYSFLESYINSSIKILCIHNKCGYKWKIMPKNFKNGTRCPKCSGLIKISDKDFKKKVIEKVKDEYIFLEKYINNKTPIKVKHNTCGNIYKVSPHNFLDTNRRCAKCSNSKGFSRGEKSLLKFIKKYYKDKIIENDRKILNGKELDIYLPKLKIAIEYCGLYWHSNKFINPTYHLNKLNLCKEKGIRLVQIFEDEWFLQRKILKSKIKHILGLNKDLSKIYARKCYIKEISIEKKNIFLDKYHIQGKDMSSIKLGLFTVINSKKKLVAVMTFKTPRSQKNGLIELSRFATKRKFNIIGGFSKLLSYFKKNYKFKEIITYADLRYSSFDNNLYEVNGFKLSHQSKPTYTYFKKNYSGLDKIRIHKTNFKKSKIKENFPEIYDSNLTEFEMMDKSPYLRIYDCGTLVYKQTNI